MSHISSQRNGVSPRKRMFSMIWPGALAAQAVYCAARLGIADHLARGADTVDCLVVRRENGRSLRLEDTMQTAVPFDRHHVPDRTTVAMHDLAADLGRDVLDE